MLLQMTLFCSFLWLSSISLYFYTFHCIVFHVFHCMSINRHLGGFHVLANANSAAMNTGVHVSF